MVNSRMVSVIGAVDCSSEEAVAAERVGKLLGEHGVVVVSGGRGGVMQAASKGALDAGGVTVGILPGADITDGNAYLTLALPTGLGIARNALVVQASCAVIAIGGGYGTLSEIGMALKCRVPVIGLWTWQAQRPDGMRAEIKEAHSPEEAVRLALQACGSG